MATSVKAEEKQVKDVKEFREFFEEFGFKNRIHSEESSFRKFSDLFEI